MTCIGLVAYEITDTLNFTLGYLQNFLMHTEAAFITGLEGLDEEAFGSNSTFEEAPKEGVEPKERDNSKSDDGADSARPIRVAIYVVVLVIAFWVWGGGPWGY